MSRAGAASLAAFTIAVGSVLLLLATGPAAAAPAAPAPSASPATEPTAVPPTPSSCPLPCLPLPTKSSPAATTAPATPKPTAAPTTHQPAPTSAPPVTRAPVPVTTGGAVGSGTGPTDLPSIDIGQAKSGKSGGSTDSGRPASSSSDPVTRAIVLVLGFAALLGLGGGFGLYLTRGQPTTEGQT